MGVSEELLEPRLLDDNEASLTQEYIKLIKSKLVEWVDRILDGEATEFIMRDKPPDMDGEGLYASSAAVILFQMVNQQIDIAEDASRGGQLLLDVTVECLRVLQYVQTEQLKTMESEAAKFAHAAGSDDVPGGLPEYLMTWYVVRAWFH